MKKSSRFTRTLHAMMVAAFVLVTGYKAQAKKPVKDVAGPMLSIKIDDILGNWNEIAHIPTGRTCQNCNSVTMNLSVKDLTSKKEWALTMSYLYLSGSSRDTKELKVIIPTSTIQSSTCWASQCPISPAWQISPFWPAKFDFWVIGFGSIPNAGIQYLVTSGPDGIDFRLFARTLGSKQPCQINAATFYQIMSTYRPYSGYKFNTSGPIANFVVVGDMVVGFSR